MRNFIIAAFIALNLNTAIADNNFKNYFKGGIGFNYIRDNKFSNHELIGKMRLADHFPLIEVGFGTYLTDDIRTELVLDYYFVFKINEKSTSKLADKYDIDSKTKIDTVMLNLYKDVASYGKTTHYVGAGIGYSRVKEVFKGKMINVNDDDFIIGKSTKIYNKFAYKLATGIDIKMNDIMKVDISYNYFNLGNNKTKLLGGVKNIGHRTYAIHNITFGMRFNV